MFIHPSLEVKALIYLQQLCVSNQAERRERSDTDTHTPPITRSDATPFSPVAVPRRGVWPSSSLPRPWKRVCSNTSIYSMKQ